MTLDGENISCLLYADDLVILSESATGLQTGLDDLHRPTYCKKWDLTINMNKSQIMIFNKPGRTIKKDIYSINDIPVRITNEYKYLGIIFKPSGSFTNAIKHFSNKAKKAVFCIRNLMPRDRMAIVPNLQLFEACVKPIILYCAEIWNLHTYTRREGY